MDIRLEDEAARLHIAVRVYNERSRSLGSALTAWERVVHTIPKYHVGIDGYVHDVMSRDTVYHFGHEAMKLGLFDFLDALCEAVDPLDDLYRDNTIPDVDGFGWVLSRRVPAFWWHRRLPRNERLLESFRVVGPEMQSKAETPFLVPKYLIDDEVR